jgi:hypothetical protein
VEARDHAGVVVVALAEALQVHVAKEIHDLRQYENWGQNVIHELNAEKGISWDPGFPKGFRRVKWMKEIERDQDTKVQPIKAHFSYNLVEGFGWLAVIMDENAFNEPFNKVA